MNSLYTAAQVKAFEKNSFIKEGDDLQAMIEAAKQSVEVLNKDMKFIICLKNYQGLCYQLLFRCSLGDTVDHKLENLYA